MAKPKDDFVDVQKIVDEVLRFAKMPLSDLLKHWDEHPEDKFHYLRAAGTDFVISREASHRFLSLGGRLRKREPDGSSLSQEDLNAEIRSAVGEMFILRRPPRGAKMGGPDAQPCC